MADISISDDELLRERRKRNSERVKAYRLRNPDRWKEKAAKSYRKHREKRLAYLKERLKDPGYAAERLAYIRAYMAIPENAERHREQARQRRANLKVERERGDPEGTYAAQLAKERAILNRWRKENRDSYRAQIALRAARERNAPGQHSGEDVARIRRQQSDKCAYCRKTLRGKGHIDHIVAVSRGGSNEPNNLQLTCKSCNSKKNAKDPVDFAQELGLLI